MHRYERTRDKKTKRDYFFEAAKKLQSRSEGVGSLKWETKRIEDRADREKERI